MSCGSSHLRALVDVELIGLPVLFLIDFHFRTVIVDTIIGIFVT